jgi:hypothetical protein
MLVIHSLGNFQQDNLGRGRKNDDGEGDAVVANAQDGSGETKKKQFYPFM